MHRQLLLINLQVICREFHSHLEDDDRKEEKVRLARLKDGKEYLTPEECEVDARSTYARNYWNAWTDFCAAKWLFADEVAQIDNACSVMPLCLSSVHALLTCTILLVL